MKAKKIGLLFLVVGIVTFTGCNKSKFQIVQVENNPKTILKPSDSLLFYFDGATTSEYDSLLLQYINPQMDKKWGKRWRTDNTWTKTTKLRIWAREFLDKRGWGPGNAWSGDYKREITTLQGILENQRNGKDGLCSYYATFFMHSCLAVGIVNRRVGWWRPSGDQLNEIYIPELQKWVVVSPLYNAWFSDLKGNPLSLIELHQHIHRKELDLVITQRDYQTTYPDPEIRKNWLATYSWDIYFWSKTGSEFTKGAQTAYRYENPNDWPYKHLETKAIVNATQNESLLNFDISSIKAMAKITEDTLRLKVVDYSIANLKEFAWTMKNTKGAIIAKESFTDTILKIDLKPFPIENYKFSVYGSNLRGGKSNTVVFYLEKGE